MIKLENWSFNAEYDSYTAPELRKYYLCGEVYGHPSFKDGEKIKTSSIVLAQGLFVETKSGNRYLLGKIHKDYLNYLKDINYVYDQDNPIKILEA